MQIISFPAHYQSVYTNFDISSFSLISCTVKAAVLHRKTYAFAMPNRNYHFINEVSLQNYCVNVGLRLITFPIAVLVLLWCRNVMKQTPTCSMCRHNSYKIPTASSTLSSKSAHRHFSLPQFRSSVCHKIHFEQPC